MAVINQAGVQRYLRTGDPRLPAARAGWEDARQCKSIDPAWSDHPKRVLAAAYENWRLRAVEARALGLSLPSWSSSRTYPAQVRAAAGRAASLRVARGEPMAVVLARAAGDAA